MNIVKIALGLLLSCGGMARAATADPIVATATAEQTYVLAEFVSSTCPACEQMRPVVDAVLSNHPTVRHVVLDADRETGLAKRYEVRCVPVYVLVDPEGNIQFNDVGMRTREELAEILEHAGVGEP